MRGEERMATSKVTVIARVKSKVSMEERVKQELLKLLAPTRSERGCINYDLHQAVNDKSLFLFHENWESEDDLKKHLESPHVKNCHKQISELIAEPIEITLCEQIG